MFTFLCTTCEAKLTVKDEKLIGKIVPCPRCGGMVLVATPDDEPTPLAVVPPQPVPQKRFPDVLSYETASGVIGHTSKVNLRAEVFLETAPPEPDVSETEIKTRKILVGVLIGLAILLLLAVGFLIVFPEPARQQTEPPPEPVPNIPNPPLVTPQPVEKIEEGEKGVIPPVEPPPEVPPQDPPVEPEKVPVEQPRAENDILSVIDIKMPGLLESSVPNIDIDAKLALPIGELNFNQSRLIDFVQVLSRLTEIPMTLDIDEMRPRSLSAQTPVSGQFSETTVGEVLTQTLATLGLQWVAADRQILIFPIVTTEETDLTFDVSDFAEQKNDLTPEVLADMVRRLVCPEANVAVLPDNRLTLVQDETNQMPVKKSPKRQRDDVLRFLEQLRAIRQLPPKTEWISETLAPETFGWDRVITPMTLNYYQEVPLSRIIAQVEEQTGLTIIVDHQSLHRAFCSFALLSATVQCDRGTVDDVLKLSLASVDAAVLTYRIIDHQTLELTTWESVRQPAKMVVQVHHCNFRADETPEEVVRSLRTAIAPDSWVVPDVPETRFGGDIVIDHNTHCLLVRQSQPVHQQIQLFLSTPELEP
jgi:DNA-directed RNA polymerase subunit RPC12/RpoP